MHIMIKNLVITYIRIHYFFHRRGIIIKGLGYVQKLLKREFVFNAFGKKFYYNPGIEGSYDYLLIGRSNEPETQIFLDNTIARLDSANFIDVGASIGEFVFSVCNYSNVKRIFAFEPRPDCASVLRKNEELNGESKISIYENAVSDNVTEVVFFQNPGGTSSGLFKIAGEQKPNTGYKVKTVMLDFVLPIILDNPVILIDVEGAEPLVLKGATTFISTNRPLIIFEFNQTSKRHFSLEDIRNILGEGYEIWRLRGDGTLDMNFANSWNCVAIPQNSKFMEILGSSKVHLN